MKYWQLTRYILFEIDSWGWHLLPTIEVNLVGNNHRVYNILIRFLCFSLVIDVDEDSVC